ncbi:MAG: septum formation inhibitor Maf [Dehalococcoidia bacterium]|nr:septum formation inhibitor Maf [Dehalococcoidia bacterium]
MTRRIILASASPGRSELLRRTGIAFDLVPSDCDEDITAPTPEEHVSTLALRKALAVSQHHPDALVIGADSVAELDGEILGKPGSSDGARNMLARLSGHNHRLLTGLAIVDGATGNTYHGVEATIVHMRELSSDEIDAYVSSGEPIEKSGSYELQGLGATIIDRIEGDFSNVVGLPMAHLARALREFGVELLADHQKGAT